VRRNKRGIAPADPQQPHSSTGPTILKSMPRRSRRAKPRSP
jgi:hypothetical protein